MAKNPLVAALEATTDDAMESGKPLADRLRMIADQVRVMSPEFATAVDTFVSRLQDAEAGALAPKIGERLPSFVLPDQKGKLVTLENLLQAGPLIVVFLRGHWCPYCRITAGALSEIQAQANALAAHIVAITPESRAFAERLDTDSRSAYPILADLDNGYAMSINLAIWVDETMSSMIAGAGWDIPTYQGNDAWILPIPAAFVVGRDGKIAARYVNPDYRERADLEQILSALREIA